MTATQRSNKRIAWIDSLKGFAIICVVLGHVLQGYMDAGLYPYATHVMQGLFNAIYTFHMPLFLCISGYLFQRTYTTNGMLRKTTFQKQLLNLVVIYLLWSVFLGVTKMLFPGSVNNRVTIRSILMIWAKPIQLYWYLYVLIALYLIFALRPLREICCTEEKDRQRLCLLAVLFIVSVLAQIMPAISYFQVHRILYDAFFFAFGMCLDRLPVHLFALFSPVAFALAVLTRNHPGYPDQIPLASPLMALAFTALLIILFQKIEKTKVLGRCGAYSLEIFLMHPFFNTALRSLLKRIPLQSAVASILLNTTLSILLCIAVALILKKVRLYPFLFKPMKKQK